MTRIIATVALFGFFHTEPFAQTTEISFALPPMIKITAKGGNAARDVDIDTKNNTVTMYGAAGNRCTLKNTPISMTQEGNVLIVQAKPPAGDTVSCNTVYRLRPDANFAGEWSAPSGASGSVSSRL